jgi:hypothetical protein
MKKEYLIVRIVPGGNAPLEIEIEKINKLADEGWKVLFVNSLIHQPQWLIYTMERDIYIND